MLQDEIPVRVLLELFGKRLKERCVVVVQQIPQLSLKGHRRDFTAAIGALPRITFPVRISVGVGIDNLKYQQTGCAFDFVVHFSSSLRLGIIRIFSRVFFFGVARKIPDKQQGLLFIIKAGFWLPRRRELIHRFLV